MTDAHHVLAGTGEEVRLESGERMPFPLAAASIVAMSLGVWVVIGLGVRFLVG